MQFHLDEIFRRSQVEVLSSVCARVFEFGRWGILVIALVFTSVVLGDLENEARSLREQLQALAEAEGFVLEGAHELEGAARLDSGRTLTERLASLLSGVDYVFEADATGRLRRVIVLSEKSIALALAARSHNVEVLAQMPAPEPEPLTQTKDVENSQGTTVSLTGSITAKAITQIPPPGTVTKTCDAALTGHFDLYLAVDPPATAGGKIEVDVNDSFCRDFVSGSTIVHGNFNDFGGGPYLTDDPGWFMDPGNLEPEESLEYEALGNLEFWDPARQEWGRSVPNQEQVRLFGGIPLEVFLESLRLNDPSLLEPFEEGTSFTVGGITGPTQAGVDLADAVGGIHTHLDFCLQDGTGDCPERIHGAPSPGAYKIRLRFFSPDQQAGAAKYQPSDPIAVVLRNGIDTAQFQAALNALTNEPTPTGALQTKLPAAGVLVLTGGQ